MKTSPNTAEAGNTTTADDVGSAAMREDVKALLVELARALQRQLLYPSNHPALRGSSAALSELVSEVAGSAELVVQVGREQLSVDGGLTDVDSPALASLTEHLHRHRVAAISLSGDISSVEVEELLAALSLDPHEEDGSPLADREWSHIRIVFVQYDQLAMDEEGDGRLPEGEMGGVWLALAQSALTEDSTPQEAVSAARLARDIEAQCEDKRYARGVTQHLLEVEQAIESSPGQTAELRDLTSELVSRLNPEALRQLLNAGTNPEERRQLLAGASSTLGAGAVVKLLREVAELEECQIPHTVWLMLAKLARYADNGSPDQRRNAAKLVRNQVGQLLADWDVSAYAPEDYTSVLEAMSAEGSAVHRSGSGRSRASVEPLRLVEMGIEVDETSGFVGESFSRLVDEKSVAALLDVLEAAPRENPAVRELWNRIKSPEVLGSLLAEESIEFATVDRMIGVLGEAAATPLLDALSDSESRGTRSQVLRRLADLGPSIAPEVVERVDDERWYVKRNMLSLLGDLETVPDGFSAVAYIEDENESVRLAAIKLLLREPGERGRAIAAALSCEDSRTVIMGLIKARKDCPEDQIERIAELAVDEENAREVRMHATRTLEGVRTERAIETLLSLARPDKGFRFLRRSTGQSAIRVEAQSVLRSTWADDPRATRLLSGDTGSRLLGRGAKK
jgi:hypothetical protein